MQVNGKLRGRVVVAAEADGAAIEQAARDDSRDRRRCSKARRSARSWWCRASWSISWWDKAGVRQGMTRSRYLVGIDLGTTNCAVAYVDTHGRERPSADIRNFEVPQLVAPGETAPRAMLPSFLYLPGEHELPPGAARLPWNEGADRIVGEFARSQGAKVPSRLVSSAKSWLCHPGIDREADILPWGSPPEVKKVSPVEASADYLRHIRDAWNDTFAQDDAVDAAREARRSC